MKDTNLIIGPINAGKTKGILFDEVNEAIKSNENILLLDPKEEYFNHFSKKFKEEGYQTVVINLREPKQSNAWNPFTLPYYWYKKNDIDKCVELLEEIGKSVFTEEGNTDPFWTNTATQYFIGITLILMKEAKESEVNLSNIILNTNLSESKIEDTTVMKKYLNELEVTDIIYNNLSATIYAPAETKSSILSVFKSKMNVFCNRENLLNLMNHTDFDLENIGKKKTVIFLIARDEKREINRLANIFITELFSLLLANKTSFNLILDNFDILPKLDYINDMVNVGPSRHIKISIATRNINEIHNIYGENVFSNIMNVVNVKDIKIPEIKEELVTYPILKEAKKEYFNIEEFVKKNY